MIHLILYLLLSRFWFPMSKSIVNAVNNGIRQIKWIKDFLILPEKCFSHFMIFNIFGETNTFSFHTWCTQKSNNVQ